MIHLRARGALSLCFLTTVAIPLRAASPGPPSHLRVNDLDRPVGTGATPFFGWRVHDPDENELQTRFEILVSSSSSKLAADDGDVWDSGEVVSGKQNHVLYAGPALSSDTAYVWKVRTWDKDSAAGPWSSEADFVVGLTRNEDWSDAKWIGRDTDVADEYTYYRKTLALPDKPVERATVYISSANKYALHVNGTLVGKGPAYHYPQFQYFNAHDITSLVKEGSTNLLAVFNHWFGSGQGRPRNGRGVIVKAVIHHKDGTLTIVGTDATWKQTEATAWITGQRRRGGEGVGYIERIDARNLMPDWHRPTFDDSQWSASTEIGAHPVAPWTGTLAPDLTRIVETERPPVSVTDLGKGRYVVDLGKVYSGVPQIQFSGGTAGEMVDMMAGYGLSENGEIDPSQNQSTDLRFHAVLDGGTFTFKPAEYYGMRYFQIDHSPMAITAANFQFVERHNRMDRSRSVFRSPNPTLNGVWELMRHSLFVCAQEAFVDTPTREKGGFLGDAGIQSIAAMPVTLERSLTQRSLNEFLQSMDQHWSSPANRGRMNAVYPNGDGARDIPDFTQAYLVWVWAYYMETGDNDFLESNYAKFKDIANHVHRHTDTVTGLITNLTGGSGAYRHGIVDWPPGMRYGYDMTAARTVINGLAYADYDIVSRIADVLGKNVDRDAYRDLANRMKEAMNTHLLSNDGVYVDGLNASQEPSAHVSQQANVFPLALDIVPDGQRASVLAKVKELEMSVGMVTVLWLVKALGEADQGGHLIELFTNEDWNGWAQCLSRGATSTWESWNALEDGGSQSHAWGAAGLYGYVRYILGVKPLRPQYEQVQIQPLDFGTALTAAGGTVPTDRGDISVAWEQRDGQHHLTVTLPVNVIATVKVPRGHSPDRTVTVDGAAVVAMEAGNYLAISGIGSGTHRFVRLLAP